MTYDNYGNITTKNGITYTYDDTWKDLLIAYNGQTITYDAQGNPTNYLGHTLTWEKGRQLKSYDTNTYTYNANGIRTSKTVGGVKHTYILDGSKILRETWGDNVLTTLWDNEDSLCGIRYADESYFFLKNLQGDIIAITDKDGAVVARYLYDAWGEPNILSDTSAVGIATINPFRYRGYYYDTETQLYYLQSRYYNPTLGRFVNVDEANIVQYANSIPRFNLYSYCVNSPITYVDYIGFSATLVICGVSISLAQAVALFALAVFTVGYLFDKNFRDAVNTLVAMLYEGAANAVGYLTNVISEAVEDARKGRRYSTNEVHHIVAEDDRRAEYSRSLLKKNGCDVEEPYNKVSIKKELHKHLHRNAYFAAVELLLRTTVAHKNTQEKRKAAIISTLLFIGEILSMVNYII